MPQTMFDFSAYITERTRDFTGREWVFAEIDRWLAEPDAPRYFIITGEPSIDKTAITARRQGIGHQDEKDSAKSDVVNSRQQVSL